MEIVIPKVIRPLNLGEYLAEMKEVNLPVWVNPPGNMLEEIYRVINSIFVITNMAMGSKQTAEQKVENGKKTEGLHATLLALLSTLLSQGPEETRFSVEALEKMKDQTFDSDPAFWPWLENAVLKMIKDYRDGQKKA